MKEQSHKAFSLLEVVIVVAIIVVLVFIAIPRMGRGTKGAADTALTRDVACLRNAIDRYAGEHGGTLPKRKNIVKQLTQYTDYKGGAKKHKDAKHIYGPYIRSIPPLPVGLRKGNTKIGNQDGKDVGWIYDEDTGTINANCTDSEVDDSGKKYNTY